jgi:vitamin B12 transporter
MKQVLVHIAFLVLAKYAIAQQDTVLFNEAIVLSIFEQRNSDLSNITIDSLQKEHFTFQHLGNIIQAHTGGLIKGYGNGQLATISLRGTGAAHTAVFWEGINLQSASLGQVDFANVPIWFFNQVSVDKGPGVSANLGAANAGGAIQLQYNSRLNYAQVGSLRGSFGLKQHYGLVNQVKGKWIHRIGVSYDEIANDFVINETQQRQTNANVCQANVIGKHQLLLNLKNKLGVAYWYNNYHRNIPATTGQSFSNSQLNGEQFKSSFSWNHYEENWKSEYSLGLVHDNLDYLDPEIQLVSKTEGNTFQNNWTTYGELTEKLSWQTVVQHQLLQVNSSGYETKEQQNRSYLAGSVNYLKNKHSLTGGVGLHLIQGIKTIPLPSVKYQYQYSEKWQFMIKYATLFKAPTFNDLYWYPLGNPSLLPESGWSSEIGVGYNTLGKMGELSVQANAFTGKINNWIIWLPLDGNWRPENKLKVENNGVELNASWKHSIGKWTVNAIGNTNYIVSRNLKPKFENDKSAGKQLIYVPFQNSYTALTVKRNQIDFTAALQYTGARYVTADNSSVLTAHSLLNLSTNITFSIKNKHVFKTGFSVLNALDKNYQMVLGRNMPGVNYQVNLIYTLKNK